MKSYICKYVLSMSSSQSTESTKWYTLYTYFVMIFDIFIFFCTDVQFQIDLMFLILVNHVLIKRFFVHIVWNSMVYKFNFVTLYLMLCIIVQVYKIFFFKAIFFKKNQQNHSKNKFQVSQKKFHHILVDFFRKYYILTLDEYPEW